MCTSSYLPVKMALRRNLNNSSINGVVEEGICQYAREDERERMDKDSGMAGIPGLSQRDQRRSQDSASVGAPQAGEPQTGVFRVWSEDQRNCGGLRARGARSAVVRVSHDGGDRAVSSALSGLRDQGRESRAAAQQGTLQQAL